MKFETQQWLNATHLTQAVNHVLVEIHSSDVADHIKGWGKNGVVGVGTWYKLNVPGYESQQGKEIFSYTVFNL